MHLGPAVPLSRAAANAAHYRRNLRHTTHHQHLPEKVTVVRVRHPFQGRSLNVFGAMHRKGRLLLVLILPDGSKSLIPADWTDLASPTQSIGTPGTTTLGSLEDLLHARALFDLLLDETCAWETLNEEHKKLAIQILARLIVQAARVSEQKGKSHE